jgi:hypothetical protein
MGQSKKRCMWSNHPALRVKSILTLYINSTKHSIGLSKHQERDMNVVGIFSLIIVLGLVKWILHSSLEGWARIHFYVKSMLMTLSLILLIIFCDEFSKMMTDRFEMSMMDELTFFLEFQIKLVEDGTFIRQMKYT